MFAEAGCPSIQMLGNTMHILKLGGWVRLWIFLSAILLFAIGGCAYLFLPRASEIPDSAELQAALSPEARAQMAANKGPDTIGVRMPNGYTIFLKKGIEAKRSTPVLAEYNAEIERRLLRERVSFAASAFAIWFGVCVIIYIFGWSVGWVYRGFKRGGSGP